MARVSSVPYRRAWMAALAVLVCGLMSIVPPQPVVAQTAPPEELLSRIRQMEERLRELAGENEALRLENENLRDQLGHDGAPMDFSEDTAPLDFGVDASMDSLGAGLDELGGSDGQTRIDGAQGGAPVDLLGRSGSDLATLSDPQGRGMSGEAPAMAGPLVAITGSQEDDYNNAYGFVLNGDFASAERQFTAFLEAHPDAPRSDEARFWLGEAQLQQGRFRAAAKTFLGAYEEGADRPRAPETLFKLGVALNGMGETSSACSTFGEVERRYPQAGLDDALAGQKARAGC